MMLSLREDEDDPLRLRLETEVLDELCRVKIQKSHNLIVPWLLMSGYLYYIYDFSILSDGMFDEMCTYMRYHFGEIKHQHAGLITGSHLEMGSLYDLTERDYPTMTKDAALCLVYKHYGVALSESSRIITLPDGTECFKP